MMKKLPLPKFFTLTLFFMAMLPLQSHAHTQSFPVKDKDLRKWKKSLNSILPKKLRSYTRFEMWPNTNMSGCTELKEDPWNSDNVPTNQKLVLYINPSCLSQEDIREIRSHKFQRHNILTSTLKREVLSIVVERELPLKLRFSDIRREIFENNFFQTPWTIGLDIKTSLKDSSLNFFQLGVIHYLGDSTFAQKSPAAFNYIKKKLFKGKTYYPTPINFKNLLEQDTYKNYGQVKLLTEGNQAFWTRFHMIESAQKSIYMSYFSWFHDVYGLALLGLILEKLKYNPELEVVILLDGKGTFNDHGSEQIKQLINHGAKVKVYNPVFLNWAIPLRTIKAGFIDGIVSSNHDKILLVDETYLTTGGRNIGDKYFVANGEIDSFAFNDTDILVKFDSSPISVLKAIFVEFETYWSRDLWKTYDDDAIESMDNALRAIRDRLFNEKLSSWTLERFPELERHKSLFGYEDWEIELSEDAYPVVGYDNTSKLNDIDELTQKLFKLIDAAQVEITLQNPYVVLTKEMLQHLKKASDRGVKINILASSHLATDSTLTVNYLNNRWRKILKTLPNARLFGYLGPGKSHSKVFVFDNKWSVVGSYNLDILSQTLNSEFCVLVESKKFAKVIEDKIHLDMENSYEYLLKEDLGPKSIPGERARHIYDSNRTIPWKILGFFTAPWL